MGPVMLVKLELSQLLLQVRSIIIMLFPFYDATCKFPSQQLHISSDDVLYLDPDTINISPTAMSLLLPQ